MDRTDDTLDSEAISSKIPTSVISVEKRVFYDERQIPTAALPDSDILNKVDALNKAIDINDRYSVISEYKPGPNGILYHGFDKMLKKEVAIKIYFDEVQFDKKCISRFKDAVEITRNIEDEHILRTLDYFVVKKLSLFDEYYSKAHAFVMDFHRGCMPFSKYLDGSLDHEQINDLFPQILYGLQTLHEHGITHRNVVPSNLLVTEDMRVLISDFSPFAFIDESTYKKLFGKSTRCQYIPPDNYSLRTTKKYADVYAVGVMLLEALTGDDRSSSIIATHDDNYVPEENLAVPKRIRNTLPENYEYILKKATHRVKSERYANAFKMARAFSESRSWYAEEEKFLKSQAIPVSFYARTDAIKYASGVIRTKAAGMSLPMKFLSISLIGFSFLIFGAFIMSI